MIITLKGNGIIIDAIQDEEDSGVCYEFPVILSGVEVYADDVDITKKKGKYDVRKDWIKNNYMVLEEPPYYFKVLSNEFEFEFTFEVPDEDFDPKKVRLIKSNYELEFLPYAIIADHILYNDEEIEFIENDSNDANYEYGMTSYHIETADYELPYSK